MQKAHGSSNVAQPHFVFLQCRNPSKELTQVLFQSVSKFLFVQILWSSIDMRLSMKSVVSGARNYLFNRKMRTFTDS